MSDVLKICTNSDRLCEDENQCIIVQDLTKHYPDVVGGSSPIVDMVVVILHSRDGCEYRDHMHIMSREKSGSYIGQCVVGCVVSYIGTIW